MKVVDETLLDRARDHAVRFLSRLPDRRVGVTATRDELLAALRVPLTAPGEPASDVIDALATGAEPGIMACAGPRYFGFVIGGSLPVREWLLDLFDLPRSSGLGFATGCQMANYTALAAARHGVLRRVGWNVEEEGLQGAPRVNIVAGAEAHVTIYGALRYLGFGTRGVQRVEADEQGRMRPEKLKELMQHLNGPTIICAQAGNVNSGAVDPMREIAGIAHKHDAWLHVDGAFGLWGRASAQHRTLLDGVELADSWATDAHKWLNVPYDCGIVIVRDAAAHRASMTTTAEYLEQTDGKERDEFDWAPEFSRRGRGFTVYAALRHLGRNGIEALIDRNCAQARQFAEILGRDPRVKILNDVVLNQVLVRFGDDDATTRTVISNVQKEGTCWLAGTTWHGVAAMRISVSNWSTSSEDVERSAAAILRCIPA